MPIDLNADVGEGLDVVDASLIPLVTSVNIACGGHAGDPGTMARAIERAQRSGAAIGAHPGYPDREGFGRRHVEFSGPALVDVIVRQLEGLAGIGAPSGATIGHVKPHGALYNEAAIDAGLASLVASAVRSFSARVTLVGPPGSALLEAGRTIGLPVVGEGFADRAYEADGSLRRRGLQGAVLEDADAVASQALSIAREGRVRCGDGSWLALDVRSICLHGDAPGAVANARAARAALADAGIEVASFGS